jgi:hypothetical protein
MKIILRRGVLSIFLLFTGIAGLYASDGAVVDTGATAWMLTSTALVLLMIPGHLVLSEMNLTTFVNESTIFGPVHP